MQLKELIFAHYLFCSAIFMSIYIWHNRIIRYKDISTKKAHKCLAYLLHFRYTKSPKADITKVSKSF